MKLFIELSHQNVCALFRDIMRAVELPSVVVALVVDDGGGGAGVLSYLTRSRKGTRRESTCTHGVHANLLLSQRVVTSFKTNGNNTIREHHVLSNGHNCVRNF